MLGVLAGILLAVFYVARGLKREWNWMLVTGLVLMTISMYLDAVPILYVLLTALSTIGAAMYTRPP